MAPARGDLAPTMLGAQGPIGVMTMLHAILILGAVGTAGAICFFALFYRFMRGWNRRLGTRSVRK
jgi:hypothetical protein